MLELHLSRRTLFVTCLAIFLVLSSAYAGGDYPGVRLGDNVEAGKLYIKIQPSFHPLDIKTLDDTPLTGIGSLDAVAEMFGVSRIEKGFILPEKVMDNPYAPHLNRWYIVHFPESAGLFTIKEAYDNCEEIEYTEFITIDRFYFEPNDPRYRIQWHLEHCGFPEAWEVSHGSDEIVIGIVDGGLDMDADPNIPLTIHEDIVDNIWINFGEDFDGDGAITLDDWNGQDDDDNGYPDDFHGWDFEDRDNWPDDPWGAENGHGTHVAGTASASTNNETGVAGAAFSCKLMIAACYTRNDPDLISHGYQGLTYCAANGANVINLSWGSDAPWNRAGNDVIQFAIRQGSILFAGAGNDNVNDNRGRGTHFYPCAYDGVIGVGASDHSDNKADFSNYGDYIDLVAPGVDILATWPRNSYLSTQGTSMSSPFAAGLGALMLSISPDLTGEELLEKMQLTSTDIFDEEDGYVGIRYRMNAANLLNSTHPSFEVTDWNLFEWNGNDNDRPEPGEYVTIRLRIRNLPGHEDAHNVVVRLENDDPAITITSGEREIGDLDGGEEVYLSENRGLTFRVHRSAPHYSTFTISITSDEGWTSEYELPLTTGHPYYLLVDDDGGEDIETYYVTDLDENEIVYDSWSMEDDWYPQQDWLNEFSFMIWETGNARDALSEDEIILFENYLDAGGSLMLIGQYIGDDHSDLPFFEEYLHVNHLEDNVNMVQLNGVVDNPITEGQSLLLIGGEAAGNNRSPGSIEPLEGAVPIFMYPDIDVAGGTYYAQENAYQAIYLAFAFEAAAPRGAFTPRHEFIRSALNYFWLVDADEIPRVMLPDEYSLSTPYPNPFNSTTNIQVSLPVRGDFLLSVHDISGRLVTTLNNGTSSAGNYGFTWNADEMTTGMYFVNLAWQDGMITRKVMLVK